MILLLHSFVVGQVSASELLASTKHVKTRRTRSQRADMTERLPLLPLAAPVPPPPGVCPCFATAMVMRERCLYPAKTAVAFYSQWSNTVRWPCAALRVDPLGARPRLVA